MADKIEFDSRPNQIPKDVQGPDNSIPLSPQWLLPKPGENKAGAVTGENHFIPLLGHANRPVAVKPTGMGVDSVDVPKKKDVFRPSVLAMDPSRRDRWHDEERDTNSSSRKDRWREGERDLHPDSRRVVRKPDQSGGRPYGEVRRAQGERWTDPGNKDIHDQRHESKWNTRWGNGDKEADAMREKWGDSGNKEDDALLDKGPAFTPSHGKDERDSGEHYRPWRPNSSSSRGRGSTHHQNFTSGKQVPTFSHGRGRGDNPGPIMSHGRDRVGSGGSLVTHSPNHLHPRGPLMEKFETDYGESDRVTYSRTKLIDIYRTTDLRSYRSKCLEGVVEESLLSQDEPTEPLAFCAPTPEELAILNGIDKGEIISSGAQQVSKEGSAGRTTTDLMQTKQNRLAGGKDDLSFPPEDSIHDAPSNSDGYSVYGEALSHGKRVHHWPKVKVEKMPECWTSSDRKLNEDLKEDSASHRKSDDVSATMESNSLEHPSLLHTGSWRSSSFSERSRITSDWRDGSLAIPKDLNNVWQNSMKDSPNTNKGTPKWNVGDDPVLGRQLPVAINREMESRIASEPSPEDLVLLYKDPQGEIQGPFSGSDIITWFESGYFGIELQVRPANSPADSPFYLLGDVMPHLRAKARPPPGFSTPKPNDIQDTSGRLNYTGVGKLHAVVGDADLLKNDLRYQHSMGSTTEAENKFLESLMAGGMSTGPFEKLVLSEGLQGYTGTNFIARPPLDTNSGEDPYLLRKKLALDSQRSVPNSYSLWPGRDAALVTDNAHAQHLAQSVESLPVHPGLLDRPAPAVNNGASGWMNFPTQVGLDPLQDNLDVRHAQNIPPQSALGILQQRLQHPWNTPLSNLSTQSFDNPTMILPPEKFLASGIPQDQQIFNLLQQQYLLQQVQSQAPVAAQQMSLLDMMLKQQQKQDEQQLLIRQQQQLLSKVLSEHHLNQPSGEPSFAHLQKTSGFTAGNANVDHTHILHQDNFQIGSQVQVPNIDESANAAGFVLPSNDPQDVGQNIGSDISESTVHLPHQIFTNIAKKRDLEVAPAAEQIVEQPTGLSSMTDDKEHLGESALQQQQTIDHMNDLVFHEPLDELTKQGGNEEQHTADSSVVKEVKVPEARGKRSKKQKSSSKTSVDSVKGGVTKSQQLKSSESEGAASGNGKSETLTAQGDALAASATEMDKTKNEKAAKDVRPVPEQSSFPVHNYADDGVTTDITAEPGQIAHVSQVSMQANAGQRAWKPAPGFKPKSLLEIQQEEQRRAREWEEVAVSDISNSLSSMSVATPWAGVVANADYKALEETRKERASSEINFAKSNSSSVLKNKNENEELFWESDVSKLPDKEYIGAPLSPMMISQSDLVVDNDFIDAKDTKKSRKKSAKAKKVAPVVAATDVFVGSSPNDRGKLARQMQQQMEVLPPRPSGPSLGDFVTWKGEPASPRAPAWSDSGKLSKPASLRDILKEQEKKVSSSQPVPIPQKPATNQPARAVGPSWSHSSSPAKGAAQLTVNAQASSQAKHNKVEDLFWGPLEQPKPEDKQSEFPQLKAEGSWGSKSSTPVKGNLGGISNRHKSAGGKVADSMFSVSTASAQSSHKGKKNYTPKHSEASDFKEWCESECMRLIGSKDTSILEYCLKISRSEAETLLIENLGPYDPNREFIDRFLSYRDFLPAEAVDFAFKSRNDRKTTADLGVDEMIFDSYSDISGGPPPADGASTKAGKKKGKKGKKVSPSVLGFNVVSNRIMMGEIQTVDE